MGERLVMGIYDGRETVWVYHHWAGTRLDWIGLVTETWLKKKPQTAQEWVKALKELSDEFIISTEPISEDANYLVLVDLVSNIAVWIDIYQVWEKYNDVWKEHLFKEMFIRLANDGVYQVFPLIANLDFEVLYLNYPRQMLQRWEKVLDEVENRFKYKYGRIDNEMVKTYLNYFEKTRHAIEELKEKFHV